MKLRIREVSGVMSTDDIIPGRYKHMYTDTKILAKHVFEDRIPGFAASLAQGDALWSDSIFGIGSSREQAATSLLAAGVDVILAPDFGRIFYRNAWNVGLRLIQIGRPATKPVENCVLEVDFEAGQLMSPFGAVDFPKPPARLQEIAEAGNVLVWVKNRLKQQELGI